MFGWFKEKFFPQSEPLLRQKPLSFGKPFVPLSEPLRQKILPFVKPMALVTALAENISEYFKDVESGEASYPAYQRKNDTVVGIWRDTRLEALRHLWGYGASDPTLLGDTFKQKQLLDAFFESKPQYEHTHQAAGNPLHDTLQSLVHVYLFLDKAGTAVGDKETDKLFLKSVAKKTIFSDLEEDAKVLWAEWIAFQQAVHRSGDIIPAMPCTLLEILYKDVTRKAKSIALSAQFGPDYQTNMDVIVGEIPKMGLAQNKSQESINKTVEHLRSMHKQLLAADDPDHLSQE